MTSSAVVRVNWPPGFHGISRLHLSELRLWVCSSAAHPTLFTQVTLLWSSGAAPSDDVGLVHWHCRRGTCAARDQHAVALPGDEALETADDLSLALALLCAP